jgi:hypothetical protein
VGTTPNLALAYMTEGSAQKEVVHNGNMDVLDAAYIGFSTGHTKTLTNIAISLFEVALPVNTRAGGSIFSSILVSDGTDQQVLSELVKWSCVNKGGVYTTSVVAVPEADALAVTLGTLTATWAFLTGTNKVTMQLTPATSLTPAGANYQVVYTLINHSAQAVTFL